MRATQLLLLLILLTVLLLGLACGPSSRVCDPSVLPVSDTETRTRVSADLEVSFRGLLVGCGHELNSLTAADLELVEERLKEEAISRLRLMDTYMELEESRRELVGDINRSLGHKAIRDVYFFDFEFVEFEPRLGSPKPK